jgi:hypothetical protein
MSTRGTIEITKQKVGGLESHPNADGTGIPPDVHFDIATNVHFTIAISYRALERNPNILPSVDFPSRVNRLDSILEIFVDMAIKFDERAEIIGIAGLT